MPLIQSAMLYDSSTCLHCGPPNSQRVGPETVRLTPPDTLILEVEATVYSAITWLYNNTTMHNFQRLDLEEYSKRLLLYNTTAADTGVYEADIHPIGNGTVHTVQFKVLLSSAPSPLLRVETWPEREEINIYQPDKVVSFYCVGTYAQTLIWTSHSTGSVATLNEYCIAGNVVGEAPLETTTQPNTEFPDDGSAIQPTAVDTDYMDYSSEDTAPPSDLFLGEAILLPSPTPVSVPTRERERLSSFPPELCSVRTMLVDKENKTLHSVLMVNALLLQDSVVFTCTAESNATSINSTVELSISENPYFETRPHPTVNEVIFQSVQFECVAIADPTPSIMWLRRDNEQDVFITTIDDERISVATGAGSSILTVIDIQLTDAGLYVCQANSNGSLSEAVSYLNIRVPATIIREPEDVEVEVTSTAQLSCQSYGIPVPEIFWAYLNSSGSEELIDDLSIGSITIVTSQDEESNITTSNLTISDTEFTDKGYYHCITSNGLTPHNSSVQRVEAYLSVAPVSCLSDEIRCSSGEQCVPAEFVCDRTSDCEDASDEEFNQCPKFPATIISGPENITLEIYSSAEFTCESYGYPDVVISWAVREGLNLRPIEASEQKLIDVQVTLESNITTGTLTLPRVELADSGEYVCQTSNRVRVLSPRTQQIAMAFLEVLPIPVSIEILSDQDEVVMEGGTLYLECHARASPTPLITWLRNGRPLTLSGESTKYTVLSTIETDGYSVSSLTVKRALPGLENDEGRYSCRLDNIIDTTTNTSAVASSQIRVQYVNNCVISSETPEISPCLNNATCEDRVGGYVCVCEGPFEGNNCSEPVSAEEVPVLVESPRDKEDVEILEQVVFMCTAVGSPEPHYSWQKDGVFVSNTSEGELTLNEIRPEDRGLYTCTAHNLYGSSAKSLAALLTIRGVYQYLVTFTGCSTDNLEETLELMTISLSGKLLAQVNATIYSFTPRALPNAPSPSNQMLVTVVTSSGYQQVNGSTQDIQIALLTAFQTLNSAHGCVFISLSRYDGCAMGSYSPHKDYPISVIWRESNINTNTALMCPCGSLDTNAHSNQQLLRRCGGTFLYGAEWEAVTDQCDYSNITHELCNITTLSVPEQFAELASVTEEVSSFDAFDISIASVIFDSLARSDEVLANNGHQQRLTGFFSDLLKANKEEVIESQLTFNSSFMLLESLDTFSLRIQLTNTTTKLLADLLQIQIEESPFDQFSGSSFARQFNENSTGEIQVMGASIVLPPSLVDFVQPGGEDPLRVVNMVLFRDTLFVFRKDEEIFKEHTLGTLFVSATLPGRVQGLVDPVAIEFYGAENGTHRIRNAMCVFWDPPANGVGYGRWSTEGCKLVSVNDGAVKCECNHLTHFGVLLAIEPLPVPASFGLEIITYIGIGVSLVCIAVILATFLCSRNLRKNTAGKLIINMCISLGLFYTWFLLAIHGRHYNTIMWFCYICSSLVQYFLLVYLCWTALEAVYIYLKLVRVFGSDVPHFVLKSAVFAWGVPFVITAVCTGVGVSYEWWTVRDRDNSTYICYPSSWPLYFGVIAPFVLIFLFNLVMFFIVMVSLTRRLYEHSKMKGNLAKSTNFKELRKLLIIGTCLSVLFGLGWVFGLLAQVEEEVVSTIAQYIFSIVVGFQGTLIFILYGLRSTEVRKQWKQWFYKLACWTQAPKDMLSTIPNSKIPPPSNKTDTTIAKFSSEGRHSENPIYQSTDHLEKQESYSPVRKVVEEDTVALLPPTHFKLSKEVDESNEAQIVELDFGNADEPSEDEAVEFSDLTKVPFAAGELGTAMGPDVNETSYTEL